MARSNDYWRKRLAMEDDETVKAIEEAVLERGADIEDEVPNDDIVHISELQEPIAKEYEDWGKVKGLRTGLPSLDEKLGGIGKGHVILIGGETSNGKSALATNIAVNIAKNHAVLFVTLEMTKAELGARIMHINDKRVDNLNMMFQTEHRLTYKDLKPLIKRAVEMNKQKDDDPGIELIVLDYLQYLGRGMTEKEVALMSKEIKTLAFEFNIPFLVIVSLRKSEGGKGKRKWTDIEIEDYMGTGAIGYDCDAAMIASRKDMNNDFIMDRIYVKMLKTRNSKLDYRDRYMSFKWDQTRISEDLEDELFNNKSKPIAPDFGFKEAGAQSTLIEDEDNA